MSTLVQGRTYVYFCDRCGHLQTSELPNLAEYYSTEYAINDASEDDDQVYKIVDGQPLFRADHQAAVLQSKLTFPDGCRVLDYGCAKAPTLRKLLASNPGIEPYLFDLTDRYQRFWQRFPKPPHTAVGIPDPDWNGALDVVLSFYALEHVSDLDTAIRNIKHLLKPGGIFYFIVPNAYQNIADFVVADHINHFSETSIRVSLERHGFDHVSVDATAHDAAYVVMARNAGMDRIPSAPEDSVIADLRTRATDMSAYWKGIAEKIRKFEDSLPEDAHVAIYGAGFYANFIALSLRNVARVSFFIDQNPHLQGTVLHDRPVIAPSALPENISHVMVGLNPRTAQSSIHAIDAFDSRKIKFLFL
ncbi:class I SAM-dependent methyltransferase [Burkholderia sp. F1]|uniref:class I SAM-dependent methyltransferase n=1 Tax=Burkholderia sp. F1 TaxID=3366817 RepID=UPI003D70ED80